MVCHKHPAVNRDIKFIGTFLKKMRIGSDVSIAGKAYLTIVSTLDDVNWNARRTVSASSRMVVPIFCNGV